MAMNVNKITPYTFNNKSCADPEGFLIDFTRYAAAMNFTENQFCIAFKMAM